MYGRQSQPTSQIHLGESGERRTQAHRPGEFPNEVSLYSCSYEESEGRSTYPTMQLPLQERKIFGFEIYVDNDVLGELGNLE